ncbi:MAG: GTPase, partial [Paludibacter sp.]
EIANYPFTTLVPNLGIVAYRDNKSFVMADIPGIIEGASEGRGLGLRFLRHIERNSILLFMIPADSDDILHEFEILLNELKQYNPELVDKQRILAITKCDILDEELLADVKKQVPPNIQTVFISSLSGMGIVELKDLIWTEINKESNKVIEIKHRPMEVTYHEEEEIEEEIEEEEEEDDLSKYKGIGWDEL